ncbi:MAG: cache domain-containing protein [Gammaproteobacteria bacterium]|nr:cache domain-containing protein [Gammaproteobacteria bacterium]
MKTAALNARPLFLIWAVLLLTGALYACQRASDESKQQLVSLVDSAAALVSSEGAERACEAFKQPDSQWFHDDTYIFIDDMSGTVICHPADPNLQGQNLTNLQDPKGTFVFQEIVAAVQTNPSGWVEYTWPKPSEGKDAKKLTYVKKVESGGKTLIVGSGIYLD